MSVPKSPVLSCSRGFLAQADVKLNSPSPASSQNQNVNVLVYPKLTEKTNPYEEAPDGLTHYTPVDPAPHLEKEVERDVTTAETTLYDMKKMTSDKDLLINALNCLLDIYEHNPLIVNKYAIADDEVLSNLIKSLTGADEVIISKEDYEPSCFQKKVEFSVINKIIVKIGDNVYNLKYNYPDVVEFLDKHKVSIKFSY